MIQNEIENIDKRIGELTTRKLSLLKIKPLVDELGLDCSGYDDRLDFDFLSHEDVIKVIAHFGGKWTKELVPNEAQIHYTRDERVCGFKLRCYAGSPPPNCQIIEEEVEVPEEVTPATTKTIRRLVCVES